MINPFKSKELVVNALAARNLKNEIISSNIANINTPFYKAKDVEFESVLKEQANKIFKQNETNELKLATTNEKHFGAANSSEENKAKIYMRDDYLTRNDANSVDLDKESTELSKNALMISALDGVLKKQGSIFNAIIEASSKLS